ncbi:MAG: hypothetical protein LBG28_15635 [Tannerella sp.]|nr:hypothetical protein [Tannerella sp.]
MKIKIILEIVLTLIVLAATFYGVFKEQTLLTYAIAAIGVIVLFLVVYLMKDNESTGDLTRRPNHQYSMILGQSNEEGEKSKTYTEQRISRWITVICTVIGTICTVVTLVFAIMTYYRECG